VLETMEGMRIGEASIVDEATGSQWSQSRKFLARNATTAAFAAADVSPGAYSNYAELTSRPYRTSVCD
jgi:hypothetical protein